MQQPISCRICLCGRKFLFIEYILQAGYNLCRRLAQLLLANDGLVGQILPLHIWGWFVNVWSVIHCQCLLWFDVWSCPVCMAWNYLCYVAVLVLSYTVQLLLNSHLQGKGYSCSGSLKQADFVIEWCKNYRNDLIGTDYWLPNRVGCLIVGCLIGVEQWCNPEFFKPLREMKIGLKNWVL